ncbi:Transcription initiation factor IIF subunit alpha [Astathelohania contejeani]|uniref:Transcription initiation factor IIF subunit alpha n=1 Tax=Astathelohania contejeani TaxID=164912 RepID=A0ABQ7HZF2_9MICR|nr:Transcription initiation factor IIF subunit alpha [Thelohania contejeani]
MQEYKLTYNPKDSGKRYIITLPVSLKSLVQPISLEREYVAESEEQIRIPKKKSEQIEYESPEYKELKEQEKHPLVLSDNEGRQFVGRLQETRNIEDSANNYYVFINTGDTFKVIPVSRWYRFSSKIGYETLSLEEAEAHLSKRLGTEDRWIMHERKDRIEETEFILEFDDDDGDEYVPYEEESEKRLSRAGKDLIKLMKNYEEGNEHTGSVEEKRVILEEEEKVFEKKRIKRTLSFNDIREIIGDSSITIKDLLSKVKINYKIDENIKSLIKEFIKNNCEFIIDSKTNEKLIKIKK